MKLKRIIALTLAVILCLCTLSACSSKSVSDNANSNEPTDSNRNDTLDTEGVSFADIAPDIDPSDVISIDENAPAPEEQYKEVVVTKTDEKTGHTHSYVGKVTTPATCEKTGVRTYTCKDCKDAYTESIPVTAHTIKETVVAPTATKQGYTIRMCTVCDAIIFYGNYTNATGSKSTSTASNTPAPSSPAPSTTVPSTTEHIHDWKQVYTVVHHDAEYGTRDIVEKWEKFETYIGFTDGHKIFKGSGINPINDRNNITWLEGPYDVSKETIAYSATHGQSYRTVIYVVETFDKVVGTEKYVIKDAYDEKVPNGYECTVCGAHKN